MLVANHIFASDEQKKTKQAIQEGEQISNKIVENGAILGLIGVLGVLCCPNLM